MLYPTIEELTQGNKYNRYELALATAKCARLITDEYVRQHEIMEKSTTKESRAANAVDRELRDEKAVKVAIGRIYDGRYEIDEHAAEREAAERAERAAREALEPTPVKKKFSFADLPDDDEEDEAFEDEALDAEEADENGTN